MFKFRNLEMKDREWVEACRNPQWNPFTALSFPSLFSWREAYGLTIAGEEDWFVIRSEHDGAYYCPCGNRKKCEDFISKISAREKEPHFLYLTREHANGLKAAGFRYFLRDDLSEYISSSSGLALEEGYHMSNSYRLKVRHYQEDYHYRVRPAGAADVPALRKIAQRSGIDSGDTEVLETELSAFTELRMQGTLLETRDGKSAFLLGYPNTDDEFTMTITRHESGMPAETTAVLVYETARLIRYDYPLVNLEEDLGITGLRQAKILYSPVDRLNVYEAIK